MVTVAVVAKHAHVLGKTADPALLLFRGIGMLQAGCSSPGAPVYPAAVVPSIICCPAHQRALNFSVFDVQEKRHC